MGELIGYTRCSTVLQGLTAQAEILTGLGVPEDRTYLGKGLTGTSGTARPRSGPGGHPRRRHPGGAQAGPAGSVDARRP
ncbi:hypothetical protein AB0L06_40680 [Spirillospora sp. NPDC052269]